MRELKHITRLRKVRKKSMRLRISRKEKAENYKRLHHYQPESDIIVQEVNVEFWWLIMHNGVTSASTAILYGFEHLYTKSLLYCTVVVHLNIWNLNIFMNVLKYELYVLEASKTFYSIKYEKAWNKDPTSRQKGHRWIEWIKY